MPTVATRPIIDITARMHEVVTDLCARLPEFAHIDPCRVLLCLARSRRGTRHGIFAKIIPMRYPDGMSWKRVAGRQYALPQIPTPRGDVLYLIYLYLPRFFSQPAERRVLTLVHELFHIAPQFDGTIRRVGGRAHGASRARFNEELEPLVRRYLAAPPPAPVMEAVHLDLHALARRATLTGRSLPVPKSICLE